MIDIIRELKVDEVDNADSVCELKVGELKNVAGGSIIWGDVWTTAGFESQRWS